MSVVIQGSVNDKKPIKLKINRKKLIIQFRQFIKIKDKNLLFIKKFLKTMCFNV